MALYQIANPGLTGVKSEDTYWMVMAGIEQNWFGIGKTTLYGEYARHEVGAGLSGTRGQRRWFDLRPLRRRWHQRHGSRRSGVSGGQGCLSSADVTLWGLGINQEISAAAMDLYISYRHFDPSVSTSATGSTTGSVGAGVKDFDAIMTGAIIRF